MNSRPSFPVLLPILKDAMAVLDWSGLTGTADCHVRDARDLFVAQWCNTHTVHNSADPAFSSHYIRVSSPG